MPRIPLNAVLSEDIPEAWTQNQQQMQKFGHPSALVSPEGPQQVLLLDLCDKRWKPGTLKGVSGYTGIRKVSLLFVKISGSSTIPPFPCFCAAIGCRS